MARLPYVDPETAPPAIREFLALLPADLNIFRMSAHAETSFRPLISLGASILTEQQLNGRLRELVILRVARLSGAVYEWVQHVPIAESAGATAEEIEALEGDDIDAACFDQPTKAVLRFATEVTLDVRASKESFDDLRQYLSAREIVELIIAVGFYMTMARIMESTDIDMDAPMGDEVIAAARANRGGAVD